MSSRVLSYEEKSTWIHDLSGVSKLVFFLLWSITAMLTYDTRILLIMIVGSLIIYKMSKTEWRQVGTVFKFILFFLTVNLIAIFFFSPYQGTLIYGTKTVICHLFGNYDVTKEQLFYELNVMMKYLTVVPSVFMFITTTNPSEFAASLNKIGVSYKVGYALALTLRYIPDVQDDFKKIKNAQEARGIDMSGKATFRKRIKNVSAIIFPLVFSSMDRIDIIANAMELRGFGKNRKRTWYSAKSLKAGDYGVIVFAVLFCTIALFITFRDGSRFYNPFN